MSAANEYRNMIEHSNERRLKALAMPLFERLKERGSDPSPPVASEEQELRERYAKLRRKEKDRARKECVKTKRAWPPTLAQ